MKEHASGSEPGGRVLSRETTFEVVLTAAVFVAFTTLYFVLAMGQATQAGYRTHDNLLFAADQTDALKGWTGQHKGSHPLDLLLVVPLSGLLGGIFGSYERGVLVLGALIGGTAVTAFFRLCRIVLDRGSSLPLALVFGLAMNQLVFGPMADTYVLAGISIVPGYALLALYLTTGRYRLAEWILAGVIAFSITFTCISQAAICLTVVLWLRGSWRQAVVEMLKFLAGFLLIVTALSVVQETLYPDAQFFFSPASIEHDMGYVSEEAATEPAVVAWDVVKTLLVHTIVGQPPRISRAKAGEWAELVYTQAPLKLGAIGIVATLLWLALLARGTFISLRDRQMRALQVAAALALLCNAVFHSFFSPDAIFLYAPFFWVPTLLMVVSTGSFRGSFSRIPWCLLAILIGINNLTVIQSYTAEHKGPPTSLLVPRDAIWRFWPGTQPPPDDWASPSFDDGSWRSGKSGFGYSDRDDVTVLSDMKSSYTTLYLRYRFEVDDVAAVKELLVHVVYDDGFALYLNGQRALSRNAPDEITYRSLAKHSHEASGKGEEFPLTPDLIVQGTNTIAAVGLNQAIDSSDFSLRIMVQAILARPGDRPSQGPGPPPVEPHDSSDDG